MCKGILTILTFLLFIYGCSAPKYFRQTDILNVSIDPTGRYLASTNGESLIIWDSAKLTPIKQRETESVVFIDFLSADAIIYANRERISVLDINSDELIKEFDNSRSFSLGDVFTGTHQAILKDYHLTPDKSLLLFQFNSRKYEVTLMTYSTENLKSVTSQIVSDVTSGAGSACIHPVSKRIVAITNSYGAFYEDAKIKFWEFYGNEPINTVKLGSVEVSKLILSPDGQNIYAGTSEGIQILRFGDGAKMREIAKDLDCRNIVLSPDGNYIAAQDRYGYEGTYIWKTQDGSLVNTLNFNSPFCFSNDESKIYAAVGSSLQVFNINK